MQLPITFTTHIELLEYLPGMHIIVIPAEVVQQLGTYNKRVLCTVNNLLTFQGGFMALGEGRAYISISKDRMKKLKIKLGDSVEIKLEEDNSPYGMPVPEELEEVLAQDEEGKKRFDKLTPGRQRYVIQHVGAVKNSNKRIERALLLIGNLKKLPVGKEDFRKMLGLE